MTVELVRASVSDKAVLRRLLQLCHYDFSEWNGDDVDEHGGFRHLHLDHYWTDPDSQRKGASSRSEIWIIICSRIVRRGVVQGVTAVPVSSLRRGPRSWRLASARHRVRVRSPSWPAVTASPPARRDRRPFPVSRCASRYPARSRQQLRQQCVPCLSLDPPAILGGVFLARFLHEEFSQVNRGVVALPPAFARPVHDQNGWGLGSGWPRRAVRRGVTGVWAGQAVAGVGPRAAGLVAVCRARQASSAYQPAMPRRVRSPRPVRAVLAGTLIRSRRRVAPRALA